MPSRNVTEIVLTHIVGRTRGRAIVGDLLELASSRGRLWYYAASFGTISSFIWRFSAAFLIACLSLLTAQYLSNMLLTHSLRHAVRMHPYLTETLGRALLDLSFVVPFAIVKYGVQDRLSRLSMTILVLTGLAYFGFNMPMLVLLQVALGLLLITCCVASANWRGALLVLVFTVAAGVVIDFNFSNLAHLGCWIYNHKPLNETSHYNYFNQGYAFPRAIFWLVTWNIWILDTMILGFVCSSLHRYFLPPSSPVELV